MIQINLLPDVKREYLKSQQTKHMFVMGAVVLSAASLAVTILLFGYVQLFQPQYRKSIQNDIDEGIAQIKQQEKAAEIVTVQGALTSLSSLQDKKLINSRLFGYLTQFTPQDVSYDDAQVDLTTRTMTLRGSAIDLEKTNALANNLKNTAFTFKRDEQDQKVTPFSSVVFTSLARAQQSQNGRLATFEVTFTFDPVLFDQSIKEPKLVVGTENPEATNPEPFNETSTGASQ